MKNATMFGEYFKALWPGLVPSGQEFVSNKNFDAMCSHLQAAAAGEIRRLVISAPPSSGKTLAASVAFPAWLGFRRPDWSVVLASYSDKLANRNVRHAQKLGVTMMIGDAAVGGSVPVGPIDCLIVDDGLSLLDAMSETARTRAKDWLDHTVSRLRDDTGVCVVIGSRVHADDLIGHCLAQGGWTSLVLTPEAVLEDVKKMVGSQNYAMQWEQRA